MVEELPGPTWSVPQEYQDDQRYLLLHQTPVQVVKGSRNWGQANTDNMFTGTSTDQQRKDTSATRDPARPNIYAITQSSPQQESSYQDYWQVGSSTLSCLGKLTLSQKADDTQCSNFPPLPPFKQREFRPGIPLSLRRYLSHPPYYVSVHTSYLMTVVKPPYTPYNTSNTCMTSIPWWKGGGSVTNYRLHLVYTVFYLLHRVISILELMHVSITVQPTLYTTVLHTSHILVNYKYISSKLSCTLYVWIL